ncbi:MAG: sensor domain-containing diguanylate cyclase [Thermoanaerobaculia bacterium]|nr:sensor domain-containing diguanylate cyclase [Thermoanaerobaculia bacterium]
MTGERQARGIPIPIDEDRRIDSLQRLNLLETPAEERFDRITRLASRVFDVPIVTLGLVDSTREWFKSSTGMPHEQISRRASFAAHVIAEEREIVITDTRKDPRSASNPLVTGEPYIGFYAGYPLHSKDGSTVGALSINDLRPREFSEGDLSALRDLAAIIDTELAVSRMTPALRELMKQTRSSGEARIDPLTRLWNRAATLEIVDREVLYAREAGHSLSILLIDVDQLKAINDRFGVDTGDEVLGEIARRMRATLRPYDSIGRYGGEEFLILLPDAERDSAWSAAERIRSDLAKGEVLDGVEATVTIGVAAGRTGNPGELVRRAERALFEAKRSGGNRVYVETETAMHQDSR